MDKKYFVYIMASKRNGTLYTGMTSALEQRVYKHKHGFYDGFTRKYKVHLLVYFEYFNSPLDAIKREKQIKKWKRSWKLRMIEEKNPNWDDLYYKLHD